jgi:hypothetical protein
MRVLRKICVAVAMLVTMVFVAGSPATAAPAAMAPGDAEWIPVYNAWGDNVGWVGLVSHVGGYWDLYVCDDVWDDVAIEARIDPGDGRILAYHDSETNGYDCYNRDIWYDVRKFRGAWGVTGTPWHAPPPL